MAEPQTTEDGRYAYIALPLLADADGRFSRGYACHAYYTDDLASAISLGEDY